MNTLLAPSSTLSAFERLSAFMEDMLPTVPYGRTAWNPLVDIKETDKDFLFVVDAPGMNRENLEVELAGDVLVIRGKREEEANEEKDGFIRKERHIGRFYRSFRLDAPVKEKNIFAEYKDGILTVTVPKAEPIKTQRVSVK
jgi:HSP20 family protein